MAQLGDLARARTLLRSARRKFAPRESVSRARCLVAEVEIALATRDLDWPEKELDAARTTLEAHGDRTNAAHAHYLEIRRLLLIGRIQAAEQRLQMIEPSTLPPKLITVHELIVAGIAIRRLNTRIARAALVRAEQSARNTGIRALLAEVESAFATLQMPAARLISGGEQRLLLLDDVEAILTSNALIVDACRYAVTQQGTTISLSTRPVLFTLIRTLAEAWPAEVSRDALVQRTFGLKKADESLRVRLRVEVGRVRKLIGSLARIIATQRGFKLELTRAKDVVVIAPTLEEPHAPVLALLADGESWSTSALAIALNASQRTIQRALDALADTGKVQPVGHGRSRRWMTPPMPGFATTLLLPAPLPSD